MDTLAATVLLSLFAATASKHRVPVLTSEQVFEKCSPAVVTIVTTVNGQSAERGAGTVVAPDGLIITNAHVITGAVEISVSIGEGEVLPATLREYDDVNDLAVLAVSGQLPKGLLLQRQDVHVGQQVYAIGNPRGLQKSISEGIVSGLRHDEQGLLIQHTAAISPGSSGGALISSSGELVGINAFLITESQNLNFAISASQLRAALALATKRHPDLPSPAALRGDQLISLMNDAAARLDWEALLRLSREALYAHLQPQYYYSLFAGVAYYGIGNFTEAEPLLEAANVSAPDGQVRQTARWYLLGCLTYRLDHPNGANPRRRTVNLARAFLSSPELPLFGYNNDVAGMRKVADDLIASLVDPSGLWYDESSAFSRIWKSSRLEITCRSANCWLFARNQASGMTDVSSGSASFSDDTLTGTYTIQLVIGPISDLGAAATWKQPGSVVLKWSEDFEALDGSVTYAPGTFGGTVPEARSFYESIFYPATIRVKLVRADRSP